VIELDLLSVAMPCVDSRLGSDFRDSLVGESDILLNGYRVLDLPENDRKGNNQTTRKQSPVASKHCHVGDLGVIQTPRDGSSSGLDTLVEASKVGKLSAVVGQSTHEPVVY
jgi:hypothetical protein